MESPDFLPPGDDGNWLEGLLGNLPEGEQLPAAEPVPANVDADLDTITSADLAMAEMSGHYLSFHYKDPNIQRPEDIDKEALSMLRTLANFVEYAGMQTSQGFVRVGDRFPDLNIRHVNLRSRLVLRQIERDLQTSIEGTTAHGLRIQGKSYFSVIKEISAKAMEFEEKRKGKKKE